jgi:hypothetical protein
VYILHHSENSGTCVQILNTLLRYLHAILLLCQIFRSGVEEEEEEEKEGVRLNSKVELLSSI